MARIKKARRPGTVALRLIRRWHKSIAIRVRKLVREIPQRYEMGKLFKSASISAQWKAIKANLSGDYPKKAPSGYDLYFQFVKKWLETCRFKKARNSNSTRLTHRLGCTFVSFVGKLWRSFPVARKNEWKAKAKPGQDQFTLNVEVWKVINGRRKKEAIMESAAKRRAETGAHDFGGKSRIIVCTYCHQLSSTQNMIKHVRDVHFPAGDRDYDEAYGIMLRGGNEQEQKQLELLGFWHGVRDVNHRTPRFLDDLAAIKAIIDPLMVPTATDEMKSIYVLVRLRSDLPENAVVEDFDWAKYLGKNETGGRHDSHFQSNSVINNEGKNVVEGMAAAIRANHRVYAWTALEVPFRLLHSVEQLLITAILFLTKRDGRLWNTKLDGIKAKFGNANNVLYGMHANDHLKIAFYLLSKVLDNYIACCEDGSIANCRELLAEMNRWEEDSRRNALAKLKITEVELRGDQAEEEMPAGDRAPTYEELMAALAQENPNHPLLHR